jgi:hypothetical protein
MRPWLERYVVGELSLRRVFTGIVFIYGAVTLFAWLAADRLIFQPHPSSYRDDASVFRLRTKDGASLAATTMKARGGPARAVVLYSHGNAEDLGDVRPLLATLAHHAVDVLAYDYEGYGTSTGAPSEARLEADILAAYEHLTKDEHVPPAKIVVYGRSVGSGPSVWLASTHEVGGLVLESAFTSPFRVVTRVRLLPWDPFPNLERIGRVKSPVLIVHAENDRLIPFSQGRALFEAAPEPKRFATMPTAGHGDVPITDRDAYDAAVEGFFARYDAL